MSHLVISSPRVKPVLGTSRTAQSKQLSWIVYDEMVASLAVEYKYVKIPVQNQVFNESVRVNCTNSYKLNCGILAKDTRERGQALYYKWRVGYVNHVI